MTLVTPPSGPDFDVTDYEALAYYRREPGFVVHDGTSGPLSPAPVVPSWLASVSYAAGQVVQHPTSADIYLRRIAQGVSRGSFDATEAALWKASGSATYAPLAEVRARDISPTSDTYGASTAATAAVNTTAINAAAVDAAASGARVFVPGGTYQYGGLVLPMGVELIGTHVPSASASTTGPGHGTVLQRTIDAIGVTIHGTDRVTDRRGANTIQGIRFQEGTNVSAQATFDCLYADSLLLRDLTFYAPAGLTTVGHVISAEECWDWRLHNVIWKQYGDTAGTKHAVRIYNGATNNSNDWQFLACRWQEGQAGAHAIGFDSSGLGVACAFFWFTQCKWEDTAKAAGSHFTGTANRVFVAQSELAGCGARQVDQPAAAIGWRFHQCLFANTGAAPTEMVLLAGTESSVSHSHFQSPGAGIVQYVNVTGNENEVAGCTRSDSTITVNTAPPATTKVHHNPDFLTEYSSTAQITSGTTSVTVTHGLAYTPAQHHIMVTPHSSLGAAAKYWVSGVGATQFTINVDVNPAATVTFAWQAQRTRG